MLDIRFVLSYSVVMDNDLTIYCEACEDERPYAGSEGVETRPATMVDPAEGYTLCADCVAKRDEWIEDDAARRGEARKEEAEFDGRYFDF